MPRQPRIIASAADRSSSFFRTDLPDRLPGHEVDRLRALMLQGCPALPDPALNEFVRRVLANDELVESYFHAKVSRPPRGVTGPTPRSRMPYTEAMRAALQAQSTNLLQPAERSLAYLAALLSPCGLFHSQHPVFRPLGRNFMPDRVYARQVSCRLLEPALVLLADRDRALAETLGAVMGCRAGDACNREQVARLTAAVYVPCLRVTALWTGA